MTITPDTKNWTWVLERPCAQCGFDASTVEFGRIPDLVRSTAAAWPAVLARADAAVRPDSGTWSALEYGAHVRDVCRVFRGRLALMLDHDEPRFPDWDQDAAALAGRYREQDPRAVAAELAAEAASVAGAFAGVAPADLGRRGLRGDGTAFTVESLGRYLAHEAVHHLHDVRG